MVAMLCAGQAMASQSWTNEATHPSMAIDRGIKTTLLLLDAIGVAPCAQMEVAARMRLTRGEPLMVGNSVLWSRGWRFDNTMLMTFARDGSDYLQEVHPAVEEPFVAALYAWECEGEAGWVALMPKCQNLAALVPLDEQKFAGRNFIDRETDAVPLPGTMALLLAGLAAMVGRV